MKNISIVPETFKKNKVKIEEAGFTHMVCSETGEVLPLRDFRLHKGKYYMPYCKKSENDILKVQNMKNSIKRMEKSVKSDPNSILIKFDELNVVKAHYDKRRCSVLAYSPKTKNLYFHNRYTNDKIMDAYIKYVTDVLKKDILVRDVIIVRGK